jgi:hypothetical protein
MHFILAPPNSPRLITIEVRINLTNPKIHQHFLTASQNNLVWTVPSAALTAVSQFWCRVALHQH